MSEKIASHHLSRKALLYVRQSTQTQLCNNEESLRLQYRMQDRLHELGWSLIEVIDEDLGRSAGGAAKRTGFERLVAEVSLGHVGVVAAREVSRFARNSRDWQQLIAICRIVDTLLIDQETIYDARRGNDRLLLGLKGTLNEYELDLLRLRGDEAKRAKAMRGELVHQPPAGYQWTPDGQLEKDADRRVQQTIELVFSKCLELGSARQTMLWFRDQGLDVPVTRPGTGQDGVVWKRGSYARFLRLLRNPIYAGTYGWGKTTTTASVRDGEAKSVRRRRKQEEWSVLIPNHHEPYVTQREFDQVQKMIECNAQTVRASSGAPKTGRALLAGLVRCRRCGHRLQVGYGGRSHPNIYRYACVRAKVDRGEPACISFNGVDVDALIGREILDVVRPGAVEAARNVIEDRSATQDSLLEALRNELQAARYAAGRAQKQFDGVDPDNRLVADELERRWNTALERLREVEERLARAERAQGDKERPRDPRHLLDLALDVERVWNATETDMRLKKRIVRTLIEEVIADVDQEASTILLTIHWKGGVHTESVIPKRRFGRRTPADLIEAIRVLARVANDEAIARTLSRAGTRTSRGLQWTGHRVASLRHVHDIEVFSKEQKRAEGWLTVSEAAQIFDVSRPTIQRAIARGALEAVQPVVSGPWIIQEKDLLTAEPRIRLRQPRRPRTPEADDTISTQLPLEISGS